jgi:hypothetical protein
MLPLAAALYVVNCLVGLAAQLLGVGFGRWHHALYAAVFVAAALALVAEGFPAGLWLVIAVLTVFPWARPRTVWHPLLAVLGLVGHGASLLARV